MFLSKLTLTDKVRSWWGSFEEPQMEEAFRQHHLQADYRHLVTILSVVLFLVPNFTFVDYSLFGPTTKFLVLSVTRISSVLVALLIIYRLRYIDDVIRFNRGVFQLTFLLVLIALSINASRPSAFIQHVMYDVTIIFSLYLLMPNPPGLKLLSATFFSAADILILFILKEPPVPSLTMVNIIIGIAMANLLGFFSSHQYQRSQRQQFALWHREKEIVAKLQEAMANIKRLKELLPICANCKKIRDDEGYWQEIEVYIRDHSDTTFSHGICPDCITILYPTLFTEEPDNESDN